MSEKDTDFKKRLFDKLDSIEKKVETVHEGV